MVDTVYKTEEKLAAYMAEQQMTADGDLVLAALSGGADSVCLLLLLLAVKERFGIRVAAAHINHQLREAADRDEAFVKALCEMYKVPLYTETADVQGFAKEEGLGIEEAARLCRYDALYRIADAAGAAKLACAHHRADQAETLLFSLCRGTGLSGMGAMHPVNGRLIRPLLCMEREEILAYLAARGEAYVTDETNADNRFSRNKIRNEVLPLLTQVNENAVLHLAQAADRLRETGDYISAVAAEALDACRCEKDGMKVQAVRTEKEKREKKPAVCLRISGILSYPPFLQKEILRLALFEACGRKKDLTAAHIEAVWGLTKKQSGRQVNLPYGITASRSYDLLLLAEPDAEKEKAPAADDRILLQEEDFASLSEGESLVLKRGDALITLSLLAPPPPEELAERIPIKAYTKWMDYDRIEKPVSIRYAEKGDWFYFDDTHKKSAETYFKEQKLTASQRAQVLVIASGMQILAFLPGRLNQAVKVTADTKRILQAERNETETE